VLHRFIGEDPLGLRGSGVNLYRYASDNLINFSDPLGLQEIPENLERDLEPDIPEQDPWITLKPGETIDDLFPPRPEIAGRARCFDYFNLGPLHNSFNTDANFKGFRYTEIELDEPFTVAEIGVAVVSRMAPGLDQFKRAMLVQTWYRIRKPGRI
jgi:hypothetical protein